jgi:hypothetical protein
MDNTPLHEIWWRDAIHKRGEQRKGLASFMILISWEVWKERNTRVFNNKATTAPMLVAKIKDEIALWSLAGAKALSNIMPRE